MWIDLDGLVVIRQGCLPVASRQPSIAPVVVCCCDAGIKLGGSGKVVYGPGKVFLVRPRVPRLKYASARSGLISIATLY